MQIIVVGESPANGFENCMAVVGINKSGKRCATGRKWIEWSKMLGIDWQLCGYVNLSEFYSTKGFGDWARETCNKNTLFIALGKKAEEAVSKSCENWAALPHPSGRNRLLNDKKYLLHKLREVREQVEAYRALSQGLRRIGGW